MKNLVVATLVTLLCVLVPVDIPAGYSQAPRQPDAHLTYTLKLVMVSDPPAEHLWMVEAPYNQAVTLDGFAFRSLTSSILRKWIGHLPAGTIIAYTASSLPRFGNAMRLSDPEAAIDEFARFCRSKKRQFGFNPVF